jgi:hypothetical protein
VIAIGTLCLLLPPHERMGLFCTTTGKIEFNADVWSHGLPAVCDAYPIDLASGEPVPWGFTGWCAAPCELMPVAPPGQEYVFRKREPVAV